jgi:hypothetical protein
MDDDYKKNLLPTDFTNWSQITGSENSKAAQLPPFIKDALINIVKAAH